MVVDTLNTVCLYYFFDYCLTEDRVLIPTSEAEYTRSLNKFKALGVGAYIEKETIEEVVIDGVRVVSRTLVSMKD